MALQSLGHQAEDFLLMSLQKIGVKVVDRKTVNTDPGCKCAIARATAQEDWHEKTDFWFYFRDLGWKRIDLSTARNPEVVNRKRVRRESYTIFVNFRTLERAAQGCDRDLFIIEEIFMQFVQEFTQ